MIDFSGVELPFSVTDLLGSGNALLGLVGAFVLLGLAFIFIPLLIGLIRNAFNTHSHNKEFEGVQKYQRGQFESAKTYLTESNFIAEKYYGRKLRKLRDSKSGRR